jgi:hypothetical protein
MIVMDLLEITKFGITSQSVTTSQSQDQVCINPASWMTQGHLGFQDPESLSA